MYWKYLKYVIRHKWFVFIECCKAGIPWRGLIHDMGKLLPGEFIPYARYFYSREDIIRRDKTGYYKPTDTGDKAFDFAWLLHQKRNRHHWQWWVLPEDDGGVKVLPMPVVFRKEMVCDWKGAGKAQGKTGPGECQEWYRANKHKMQLHPDTRAYVEAEIGFIGA